MALVADTPRPPRWAASSADVIAANCARGWWRADRTFLDDFLRQSRDRPDRVAIVADTGSPETRRTLSFRQVGAAVDRFALALLDLGVSPGEVVSFQLPNWWQFPVLALACARIGAISTTIPPILRAREITHVLNAVQSRVCIVPGVFRGFDHAAMMDTLAPQLPSLEAFFVIGGDSATGRSFDDQFVTRRWDRERPLDVLDELRPAPDDVAQIQFTSGTTGSPKGVAHTYNTLYASYRGIVEELALDEGDSVHVVSTMAHQTGFLNGCVMPMAEGMKVVYQDTWSAETMLSLIRDEAVTYTSGATPFMIDVCDAAERQGADVSTLRYFRSGGSAVPAHVIARARSVLGAKVILSWGMTENGVCTMSREAGSSEETAASDGFPLPWVELKVTSVDGLHSASSDEGLLWVKSASQCIDYVPDHEAYVAAFDAEGWFNTGDLARLLPDGSLRITGRLKDMVIRGGENVPVVEVEHALLAHSAIAEVAIVGIPDPRLGERACAVVVLSDDAKDLGLSQIQDYLLHLGMAKQFWPEYVVVRVTLPRTAAGKVRKAELRASVLAQDLAAGPPAT
jgi:cyclohexanecarboxylate-CoA ligase